MFIVDTNVVAYLLIQGDQTAAAQKLHSRDPDWRSEAFLLVEFTNVLASSIATNRMTLTLAQGFLAKAIALFDGKLARVAHPLVLAIAARYRVSAYDARFLRELRRYLLFSTFRTGAASGRSRNHCRISHRALDYVGL